MSTQKARKDFVLAFLSRRQRPDKYGSPYGVPLRDVAWEFKREFAMHIGPTINSMIIGGQVVAVYRDCSLDRDFNQRNVTHIFVSYPDYRYPDQFDPRIYLPGRLPRSLIPLAKWAPNKKVKAAILRRKQQAQETARSNM